MEDFREPFIILRLFEKELEEIYVEIVIILNFLIATIY